jgi:LuxR family maltose regulon positive regulatory protein
LLDGHERTVPQFVANVVTAILQALPELREEWRPLYEMLRKGDQPPEPAILQGLIDVASTLKGDVTVILDDYHKVESHEVHAFLNRLIGHMPASMHLMIGSRTTPPLRISRLRAQGLLRELRAPHLRFETDEARQFLTEAMHLDLTSDQVELLEERTEGWIAGLHLAAISLQETGDVQPLVSSFSGTNPYVLGYLADEVLQRQPELLQEFLVKTSILDRLSKDVCDYITGGVSGGEYLERLEEMNLFIVALDEERHWYRYHPLFADFLRLRLSQRYTEQEIRELHRRASEWFLRKDCIDLAVEHALQAHDWNLIRTLIEPVGLPMIFEFRSIRNWLLALSDSDLQQSPMLATMAGWSAISFGRFRDADRMAHIAEAAISYDAGDGINGFVLALKARIASVYGDGEEAVRLGLASLQYVSALDYHGRSAAFYTLGMAYYVQGLPVRAEEAFTKARREIQQAQRLKHVMMLLNVTCRSRALLLQGKIHDAWATVQEAGDLAAEFALPKPSGTFVIQGEILLQRNQLHAARAAFIEAIALGHQRGLGLYIQAAQVSLTAVYAALGDLAAARDVLADLRRWSIENGNTHYLLDAEAAYMTRLIVDGELAEPRLWIERTGVAGLNVDHVPYDREKELLVYARLQIADGFSRNDQNLVKNGIAILEKLLDAAKSTSRHLDAAAARAALAIALARLGEDAYLPALEAALKTAVGEQAYHALLIDEAAMRSLLDSTERRGHLRELIGAVRIELRQFEIVSTRTQHGISEPLSERERDVLLHLASGLSTKEIADTLIVSTNTVKTHIRHVYDKLDAHSRTQALARARDLGLLE